MAVRSVLLRFNSNVEGYQVCVDDGTQTARKRVTGRKSALCFCARSTCLKVVASPLVGGSTLYFWIDITCSTIVDLYFNFPAASTPTPPTAVNTFTLRDSTYGLPIDGSLLFTQA